ncbi:hypothetical protein [Falsiphaeobacter marinintestinus]|uniref:hypothetical protein n=1 Tax=Falsiphaeobacter marinintestinus TaxID=1492905 RepID=UPI0011B68318|nr:hypothetical protein [Phaeobacter marinintestinus]
MPLELLLALVVIGIAGIALLLHLMGRSDQTYLTTEDARAQWHRHFPDDDIIDVTLTQDAHAAVVRTREGTGLLWSFGADTVGRHLIDFDMIETEHGLQVMFHDYASPKVTLHLTEFERAHFQTLMRPL